MGGRRAHGAVAAARLNSHHPPRLTEGWGWAHGATAGGQPSDARGISALYIY